MVLIQYQNYSSMKQTNEVFDILLEGVQIINFQWQYLYVNDALCTYSSFSKHEMLGAKVMDLYPGVENTELFKRLQICMKQRITDRLETPFVFPDGKCLYFELRIQPIPEGIFILSIDRTEQKKAADNLIKKNMLHAFSSAVNQSIVHIQNEQQLMERICQLGIHIGLFNLVTITFASTNTPRHLKNTYGSTTLKKARDLFWKNNPICTEANATPFEDALLGGKAVLASKASSFFVYLKETAKLETIQAISALPISCSGETAGVFELISERSDAFDMDEMVHLEEIATDISFAITLFANSRKHKETEELIQKKDRRFRALIEKSNDLKTLTNAQGKIIYGSPSVSKLFGYRTDELQTLNVQELIHPQDLAIFLIKRDTILNRPNASFDFQHRRKHKSGGWIWCEGTVTNMLHEPGVEALVSNFRDITHKKKDEIEREFDRNNLHALINSTTDSIWSVDRNYNLITFNQAFEERVYRFNQKRPEKGQSVLKLGLPAKDLVGFQKNLDSAMKGNTFTVVAHTVRSGIEKWSEISFFPIRKGQEIIGTACHLRDITEKKKLEETQQKYIKEISEYKYALDQAAIVAITDQKGIIKHINQNFCNISQYDKEELLGKDHRIINSRYHPPKFFRELWTTIGRGKIWRGEIRNQAKDGSYYWVDTTIVPFLDAKRKPYQYLAIRADITQQKEAQELLSQSEKRLKEAQSIARLGSWEMNFTSNIAIWSEEHCRIYGLSPNETTQSFASWASFLHPEDLGYVLEKIRKAQQNLENASLYYRIVCKNGLVKHVYSRFKIEYDTLNKPIGIYGITHDITDLKEKETQLRKSEGFNKGILRSLSDNIAVVNCLGNIIAVNESWKRFAQENRGNCAVQPNAGEGNNYFEDCAKAAQKGDEIAARVLQGIVEVLEGQMAEFHLEYPCHSPGKQNWFGIRITKFDSEEPIAVISHHDITERKKVEEDLLRNNEELQKTNEELDRFVYSASHDLRSPLTSVLGLVSLIEATSKEENTLLYNQMIRKSIQRLVGFTSDILHYSQNSRLSVSSKEIPLEQTIVENFQALKHMNGYAELRFEVQVKEECAFYSDPQRIDMILGNLFSNAVKFSDVSKHVCMLNVHAVSKPDYLLLSISDNGIGIPYEYQNKIFQMFFRLPSEVAGTGIGLYIVKQTVEKLGGTIRVLSHPGAGSTFEIRLKNHEQSNNFLQLSNN